jgi:hypothetical protein
MSDQPVAKLYVDIVILVEWPIELQYSMKVLNRVRIE